jgi:hypothetical protein
LGLYGGFKGVNLGAKRVPKNKVPPYVDFLKLGKGYLKIKHPPYVII